MTTLFNFVIILKTMYRGLTVIMTDSNAPNNDLNQEVGHTSLDNFFAGSLQGSEGVTDTDGFPAFLKQLVTDINVPYTLSIKITEMNTAAKAVVCEEVITMTPLGDLSIDWDVDTDTGNANTFEEIIQDDYRNSGMSLADYINANYQDFDSNPVNHNESFQFHATLTKP